MSTSDQAAIDAAWGDTVARVSPRFTPAAIVPPTSFHGAERLHYGAAAGAGTTRADVDASWAAAVAKVNAEEDLGPAPSADRPGRPDRSR